MNIKMSDVAKAAGVSLATVGRVLHNNGYVAEDKRKKIEKIIKEMGYIPNRMAQGLKGSRSKLIGHMVLFNTNMQFREISSAVNGAASKNGYQVLTQTSYNDVNEEVQHIDDLIGQRVDGVIITSHHSLSQDLISRLSEQNIPVVMVERVLNLPRVDQIIVHDHESSKNAVNHMIQKGHREIAFIGAGMDHDVERNRYQGYLDALDEAGIRKREELVQVMPQYSIDDGRNAVSALLDLAQPPSAIFMTSDIYACGVLQVLYERGIRVPDDISLIGYDNTLSALLSPPITSMGLPFEEIGEHAVNLILQRLEDIDAPSQSVSINPYLMDRNTVKEWKNEELSI